MNVPPKSRFFAVFGGLLSLLAVTVSVAFLRLGPLSLAVAMSIALLKALLIILYFMDVRSSPKMLWLFAGAGFAWLFILVSFVMTDYLTRSW
jgi:cytochrome c oxidase subunit 4